VTQTPFDGVFGAKFDILKPRWLPTADIPGCEDAYFIDSLHIDSDRLLGRK
jgi:hypothetical protein